MARRHGRGGRHGSVLGDVLLGKVHCGWPGSPLPAPREAGVLDAAHRLPEQELANMAARTAPGRTLLIPGSSPLSALTRGMPEVQFI